VPCRGAVYVLLVLRMRCHAPILLGLFLLSACNPIVPVLLAPPAAQPVPPLEKPAETDDIPAAQKLLNEGANVNAQDKWQRTPLVIAVSNNHIDMVEFLLAHGANVNQPWCSQCWGMNGATPEAPICILCFAQNKEMATLLLAHGADVRAYKGAESVDGTPLHYASESGNKDLAALYIADGADVNSRRSVRDDTPLFLAVQADGQDMAQFLIAHGADVNARNKFGRTPIFNVRSRPMVELLVEHGADLNSKDIYRKTPLITVVEAQERFSSCNRQVPLCADAVKGYEGAVRALIDHAAK